ncbi:Protein NRDE2-like protein [Larimichthys crocea]|uniref:Uncharacterized protein n=1 Tax=Larimichthys crocea TaxID=215358 RepID=A0ACD3RR67_LARCR|nr:Protein NRDE2-like protein [Larimichthys crocea]
MALFPAYAEVESNKVRDSSKELDLQTYKSFQTGGALSLHSRYFEKTSESKKESSEGREVSSAEEEEEGNVPPKKKKKKSDKKRRKKKKHKKKSGRYSDSSRSDSDTIFRVTSKGQKRQMGIRGKAAHPWAWTLAGRESAGRSSESNKKQKGRDKKKAADRYFSAVSRQLLRSEPPVPTLPTIPERVDATGSTSFLLLGDDEERKTGETGNRTQTSSVNPLGVYDSSTALWLQGKGQQEQPEQPKQDIETGQSAALLSGRTEEFNRRLREQPADTQLWIKFIRYQDELSAAVFGVEEDKQGCDPSERRKSSYRAVLEKKLSIAERAVATNPGCIALQLERLRVCQELWEPSLLAKEWKKLVFLHPNSTPLWREYLLFTQSYFSNFTVPKVNSAYGKCLSTLSAVRDGSMLLSPGPARD